MAVKVTKKNLKIALDLAGFDPKDDVLAEKIREKFKLDAFDIDLDDCYDKADRDHEITNEIAMMVCELVDQDGMLHI